MSRRIRRLFLLGLLCLGVIIVVPEPYSDAGAWHSMATWGRDLQWKWEYRERAMRINCGWRKVLLCQQLPAWTGPLAQTADSFLKAIDKLQCQQWESTRSAGVPLPGEDRPFLGCQAIGEDTSVSVMLDWHGLVAAVDRGWTTPDPRATFEEVVARMEALYGPGQMCPQSDDLTVTDNVRWQLDGFNSGVYLAGGRYIHVDHVYGKIQCHTV